MSGKIMSELKAKVVDLKKINSSNFLIFVQGSWEIGNNNRNAAASKKIADEGIASTMLYESPRDWNALENAATVADWKSAFDGKTYGDELQELRDLIGYVNKEYKPENLFLSGYSYGGGLVTLVAGDDISNLNRVLLFAPQIECVDEEPDNIYRGFPQKKEFLEAIAKYNGKLRMVHGMNDTVVDPELSLELYGHAKASDSSRIVIPTDHTFENRFLGGYVEEHVEFFGDRLILPDRVLKF